MASVRHIGLFPWCFDPSSTFFETEEEIRDKAVPMWWKVKEWTLESTFEIKFFNPSIPNNTITDTDTFKITDLAISGSNPNTFKNEKDLVCAGVIYDQESGYSYQTPYNWSFGFQIGSGGGGSILSLCSIVIGPNFLFEASGDDTRGVTTAGDGTILGNLNINLSGVFFSVPLRQASLEESLYMVESCTCNLNATEYWGYDPNN